MTDHNQPRTGLTHLNEAGAVHMVDISEKVPSRRMAIAEGKLYASASALDLVKSGASAKGDVLAVARVAAIMAAKRTAEWIPLCHSVALTGTEVTIGIEPDGIRVTATTSTTAQTGVEMEALTAVHAGLLTLYDMLKSVDRAMHMEEIRLLKKSGGRSGLFEVSGFGTDNHRKGDDD
jgi:cyclic pyranopterin phosphate synthase